MKKINILKIVIIILMLLCIITIITYAYFSEIIQNNGQINSTVKMPNGAYSFTVSHRDDVDKHYSGLDEDQLYLYIGQKNMTMSGINNEPIASNSTSFVVYLESKMNDEPVVCTYDLDLSIGDLKNYASAQLPLNVDGVTYNHELSMMANQTSSGVIKTLEMDENLLPETELVDLKFKNSRYGSRVIYNNAVISNNVNGTKAQTKWVISLNYYNLPVVQNRGSILYSNIYLRNVNCQNLKPRVLYENETFDNIGTEVALGNERFYVIGSNDTDVTLLSKYNLKVGVKDTNNISSLYTSTDKGYNMQCKNCLGYISDTTIIKSGTTAFSSSSNLNYSNSLVKTYIDNYVNNIKNYYKINIKASRLMTLNELINLGCTNSNCNVTAINDLSRSWLYSSSYWVDGYSGSNVYNVRTDGVINTINYSTNNIAGIRPVIVVSKADFATIDDEK